MPHLLVQHTEHELGVFANEDIKKGEVVTFYTGANSWPGECSKTHTIHIDSKYIDGLDVANRVREEMKKRNRPLDFDTDLENQDPMDVSWKDLGSLLNSCRGTDKDANVCQLNNLKKRYLLSSSLLLSLFPSFIMCASFYQRLAMPVLSWIWSQEGPHDQRKYMPLLE